MQGEKKSLILVGKMKNKSKTGKKMITLNTGILLGGHAFSSKLSLGDRISSGTFLVITSRTKTTL